MISLKFKWASHAPLSFANNDEFLKLASKAGYTALFVGFESLTPENLSVMEKPTNLGISPTDSDRPLGSL